MARAIHARSKRAQGPFVKVNCGALTETLLESELFGHEKGAFTGAVKRKLGRFELADKGTLFLDEIGDVTPGLQLKLLRVLQEREFERVGGEETIKVDVRVLSATHRDIQAEVAAGRFREDLFYRLHVVPCTVPALRERKDDIPRLCAHFIAKLAPRTNPGVKGLERRGARPAVRLRLAGQRARARERDRAGAGVRGRGGDRRRRAAARSCAGGLPENALALPPSEMSLPEILEDLERQLIQRAYDKSGGVKTETARLLGIKTSALYYKLEKYGIGVIESRSEKAAAAAAEPEEMLADGPSGAGSGAGAIVRADHTLFARRTAIVLAVAIVAGIGVALGCASEASARRGAARSAHVQNGRASYYGKEFVAAHRLGRALRPERDDRRAQDAAVRHPRPRHAPGRAVGRRCSVNDRCGCTHGRIIDVSEARGAQAGHDRASASSKVRLEVVPWRRSDVTGATGACRP